MQKEETRPGCVVRLARAVVLAALASLGGAAVVGASACSAVKAPPRADPEATCARACTNRAASHCTEDDCARGCRFVLDRLAEREGDRVIDCVARAKGPCGDALFAECAVLIGEHADGGPPAPPPPEDD